MINQYIIVEGYDTNCSIGSENKLGTKLSNRSEFDGESDTNRS